MREIDREIAFDNWAHDALTPEQYEDAYLMDLLMSAFLAGWQANKHWQE